MFYVFLIKLKVKEMTHLDISKFFSLEKNENKFDPDIFAWPVCGPGSENVAVFHIVDTGCRDIDHVLVLVGTHQKLQEYVYDYRLWPYQPLWINIKGEWICRETKMLLLGEKQEKEAYPVTVESVVLFSSLEDFLQQKNYTKSFVYPSKYRYDFPRFAATIENDKTIICFSSPANMKRGESCLWMNTAANDTLVEYKNSKNELILEKAIPDERYAPEKSYCAGIFYFRDKKEETVLVWNKKIYVCKNNPCEQVGELKSYTSDEDGVFLEAYFVNDSLYYVIDNAVFLEYDKNQNAEEPPFFVDGVRNIGLGPNNTLFLLKSQYENDDPLYEFDLKTKELRAVDVSIIEIQGKYISFVKYLKETSTYLFLIENQLFLL